MARIGKGRRRGRSRSSSNVSIVQEPEEMEEGDGTMTSPADLLLKHHGSEAEVAPSIRHGLKLGEAGDGAPPPSRDLALALAPPSIEVQR